MNARNPKPNINNFLVKFSLKDENDVNSKGAKLQAPSTGGIKAHCMEDLSMPAKKKHQAEEDTSIKLSDDELSRIKDALKNKDEVIDAKNRAFTRINKLWDIDPNEPTIIRKVGLKKAQK